MSIKKTVAIIAAAGALTALALPALAETTFYGSARVGTFWDSSVSKYTAGTTPDSSTDFDLRNQATSRFGVVATDGNLGGKIELGLGGLNGSQQAAGNTSGTGAAIGAGGNSGVYTRLLYGTYKFNAGTLLVGQTYAPYWQNSEQVAIDDQGNNGFGSIYDGRQPEIKFTLNNGLYLAAIRPGTPAAGSYSNPQTAPTTTFATTQTSFPKIAIGYDGKVGNLAIGGGIAGQTYINQAAGVDKHINSVLGYVHGKLTAGAADFGFNIGLGQNLGDMGLSEGTNAVVIASTATSNAVVYDTTTASVLLTAGLTVSPTLKLNAGVGYVTTTGAVGANATGRVPYVHPDNKMSAFVNAPIVLAKGVTIVPEFTYQDQLEDTAATTANTSLSARGQRDYIWGAKWQMDF